MKLLLDAGNSRLKWGLIDHDAWVAQGAFSHDEPWDLGAVLPPVGGLDAAFGVNVAGEGVAARVTEALRSWTVPLRWWTPEAACCGVRNGYDDPAQLGADRWAALVGAWHLQQGAALVVTAGTATTIDVLMGDGRFAGGLIVPGVELMKRALAGNTAQLPLVEGSMARLPTRTADAIHMGCLHAQAGAIERMFRYLSGESGAVCLINGGAAPMVMPLLGIPCRLVDNLVLEGVRVAGCARGFR
ncbi:type III pantothenate kinase [Nitrogeniibacter mangrovi]|uniref:Type III pantothenate kinase n=1 Tax=Nitrogeniibacter mangrovi TaxID=2016596 RepID=A0A6C1B600_9RHOO|nr:type III pantothenate kinase [Nitrogeniibacter mangrovi]QID18863.1 type III pantothenate kinase [Nitrogeniibacter mangrovi]